MTSWHSYPSIFALGHRAVENLFSGPVTIEEKVDGSQFSWGLFDGELRARSKGQQLVMDAPEKMFNKAVELVVALKPLLHDGWTYRGEFLRSPHHNALTYSRVPKGHVVLFDINTGEEEYMLEREKKEEAERLGLEVVPTFNVVVSGVDQIIALLENESFLGGTKIEGVVVKNYSLFGLDKKVLMGKYVSEAFKEVHNKTWHVTNPRRSDVVQWLVSRYKTDARWEKGIQHLREQGVITDSPKDIGPIMKEIQADIQKECEDEIKAKLFEWAKPHILRGALAGFPLWYKDQLLKKQFEGQFKEEARSE